MTDSAVAATEQRNPATLNLDQLSVAELLAMMNAEDRRVPDAVARALPKIAEGIELAVAALSAGGRLIYLGAGTSGRLGVLDAAECPPTFSTSPELVVGVLAGGEQAMFAAVEGAEDSSDLAKSDLRELQLSADDLLVGIAASGRTPYVIGGLQYAKEVGASTVSIACTPNAAVSQHAQVSIEVDNGPEVLTGSTRLKAGTSQKLILNMISTATMVRLGKTYGNLMVDVAPTNQKLIYRAQRIVVEATGCTAEEASTALAAADHHAKTAIVMILANLDVEAARERLTAANGFVRIAITNNS